MVSIAPIFMRLLGRVNPHWLCGVSALLQVAGMALLALAPLTLPLAIVHECLAAVRGRVRSATFFLHWSAELFPTLILPTGLGVSFDG